MRKMDYFGTFLNTLNADRPAPRRPLAKMAPASSVADSAAAADDDIESVLRLLPREPGAEISIVELARMRGVGISGAAAVLQTAESLGLVHNNSGQFSLTVLGRQAAEPAA